MKKTLVPIIVGIILLVLLIPMAGAVSAAYDPSPPYPPARHEGCSPGFWKNNLNAWGPTGASPSLTLGSVFTIPPSLELQNYTLLEALNFGGGPGTVGMAKILLRQAVAAALNAAHPDINYPLNLSQVIDFTNSALASGNRATMEQLKNLFDGYNNLGCPIDAHGNVIR